MKTTTESKLQINAQAVSDYRIEQQMLDGVPHMVVPVVMMVEGVHSGSHGPTYHSISELGKFPATWNGIPIVIKHPQDEEGNYISANSPGIQPVGRIYNTHVDGAKLKGKAFINVQKITAQSPTALGYIQQGMPLEVSVGIYNDEDYTPGEWNGEAYNIVALNHRPDHLALLPGEVGACSWNDGCGIRNNQESEINANTNKNNQKDETMKNTEQFIKDLVTFGAGSELSLALKEKRLVVNGDVSYEHIMMSVQRKLDSMDTEQTNHYLQDAFSNNFVYTKRSEGGEAEMYKQGYSLAADNSVEFVGEPVKVRRDINYVTVNSSNNNKNQEDTMSTNKKDTPCLTEAVNRIIANKANQFVEDDREWLMGQEESVLKKLDFTPKQEPVTVNAEKAMEALKDTLKKPEDFFKLLPDEMRDEMESGLRLHKDRRATMIQQIMTNAKDVWEEDSLKSMDTSLLEKVHKSVASAKPKDDDEPVDYSAAGGSFVNTTAEEFLPPTGVKMEESK